MDSAKPSPSPWLRVVDVKSGDAVALCERGAALASEVDDAVRAIVLDVKARGDVAVQHYTEKFDKRLPRQGGSYELSAEAWDAAANTVSSSVRAALGAAAQRIRAFHEHQREPDLLVERDGIRLELRVTPLSRVGLYVPGGTARYPSSVLMTAIPARVAGVGEIIMVTPGASPETLLAARLAGVDRVFELGGAQAVAALAFGTHSVPRVDKIVGPGNQWVAAAKRMVFGEVDIDSVAGPSEILVIADAAANPRLVAADLIAQAEHDVEARAILVTPSRSLVDAVELELGKQLLGLPRAEIAGQALRQYGAAVVVPDLAAAVEFANRYAPEHLELQTAEPRGLAVQLTTAGAIFVGQWASEAAGDYVAGSNHVLPTGGAARYASPLGVYDFRKRTSIIEYSREAAIADAEVIETLAEVEGLVGHGQSAAMRKSL